MRGAWKILKDEQSGNNMSHEFHTGDHSTSTSSIDGDQNVKGGANS